MPVEHRSDEEPGGDLTGKFAHLGREREGQNGNLSFAEAMITFYNFPFRGPESPFNRIFQVKLFF